MGRDVGSYFEKLTRTARGGRRHARDSSTTDDSRPRSAEPAPPDEPTAASVLKDVVGDVLGRGRAAARKTTRRAGDTVRARRRRVSTRRLPAEGVVAIEYSPRIDGDPDPGEVVWIWVPFEEDPEQGKDRPVVVIGRRGGNLVGVPLTTKRNDREAQISIGTGDWDPQRRPSYARIWRMLDLDADRMRREGAVLDQRRFDQVIAAVDEYYDVKRPRASG